jgi:hypothetical protein
MEAMAVFLRDENGTTFSQGIRFSVPKLENFLGLDKG